jgi:prophage antirepressor-like protein
MGIELDVLVGHPEHDLLFVATQVARAAGLKNPSVSVAKHRVVQGPGERSLQWGDVVLAYTESVDHKGSIPGIPSSRILQMNSWVATEAWVYSMLLKGHAPQSEPFRRWVTEEVLPTIRKTGKYDAEQSTNPIALSLARIQDSWPVR